MGFEPTAKDLKGPCTAVVLPVQLVDQAGVEPALTRIKNPPLNRSATGLNGTGGKDRTCDFRFRRPALLSTELRPCIAGWNRTSSRSPSEGDAHPVRHGNKNWRSVGELNPGSWIDNPPSCH